jgi:hypothetical protein
MNTGTLPGELYISTIYIPREHTLKVAGISDQLKPVFFS